MHLSHHVGLLTSPSSEPPTTKSEPNSSIWIDAWYDPLAGLGAFSSCMCFSNINGDGDHKLVIADIKDNPINESNDIKSNHLLKIYKGTSLINQQVLMEEPVAVCSYFMDTISPRKPVIAVAGGCSVYLFKNLQPYYKFDLPPFKVSSEEQQIWNALRLDKINAEEAIQQLHNLDEQHVKLTDRSLTLLQKSNDLIEAKEFIKEVKCWNLVQQVRRLLFSNQL